MNSRNINNKKSALYRPWLSYALAAIAALFLYGTVKYLVIDYMIVKKLNNINASLADANVQEKSLSQNLRYYNSPVFLNEYAKNILNMQSPNEKVIIFSNPGYQSVFTSPASATPSQNNVGWFKKILNKIF